MNLTCPHCTAPVEVNGGGTFACYACEGTFTAPEPPVQVAGRPRRATKERNWGTQTGAAVLMLAGFGSLLFAPIGILTFVLLLGFGCWLDARCFQCSECGTTLNRKARICPGCKAAFY